jgi:hypothetical protein
VLPVWLYDAVETDFGFDIEIYKISIEMESRPAVADQMGAGAKDWLPCKAMIK